MINNLESTSLCDIKYKIVFLGNMSVGKSSIIQRFINGNFDEKRQGTVGIDFLSKNLLYNGHMYRLLLWDTAGQEKFKSLIPAYLKDAHCAVLVYDITNQQSFKCLHQWMEMFNNYRRKDSIMLVVGNKTDLKDQRKYAKRMDMGYFQLSAKKNEGIQVLFQAIVNNIQILEETQEQEKADEALPQVSTERLQRKISAKVNKNTVVNIKDLNKTNKISCCSI